MLPNALMPSLRLRTSEQTVVEIYNLASCIKYESAQCPLFTETDRYRYCGILAEQLNLPEHNYGTCQLPMCLVYRSRRCSSSGHVYRGSSRKFIAPIKRGEADIAVHLRGNHVGIVEISLVL